MKNFISVALLLALGWVSPTWACVAQGSFDIKFSGVAAKSVTKIIMEEECGWYAVQAYSVIYEEGIFVDDADCFDDVAILGLIACAAIARDHTITENCTYCNVGTTFPTTDSFFAVWEDEENVIIFESTTDSNNIRCDIPPDSGNPE